MNRLPPSLLYLVIYNPTLKPLEPTPQDDEDAEEQAHVLFYTANNQAVSKDRVLRQVGLAKAMGNFTTIFDTQATCESIHSQSRRMVMLSPEPDFWIHACFELEKILRVSRKEEKGKGKQKESVYDHNEASLHDTALRMRLLLGYEAFKVTHGSFTSILKKLNKEALVLQLERFFTVWAWSWDLGKQISLSEYLVPSPEKKNDGLDGIACQDIAGRSMELIDRLRDIVSVEQEKIASAFSSTPIQNVLQKTQYIVTAPNQFIYTSASFSANSWHLHEGKRALGLDPDLLEIFSRGQNPQDWHLVKRGFGANKQSEVYMEIARKEASLVDVDSEIIGVLRRFTE